MDNLYIVIGSRGNVGSQIMQRLRRLNKCVITQLTSEILEFSNEELVERVASSFSENSIKLREAKVGVILAHRYRGDNVQIALENELRITRDFIWALSMLCESLRVVVLVSITGRHVDQKMPEAYHYAKDLQKSIVRQSVRIKNLHMNLLELNWFEKFVEELATDEYRKTISNVKKRIGGDNLPSVDSITEFACALIELQHPPRGATIIYDGGFSLFQEN